jgi:hypothetical protein
VIRSRRLLLHARYAVQAAEVLKNDARPDYLFEADRPLSLSVQSNPRGINPGANLLTNPGLVFVSLTHAHHSAWAGGLSSLPLCVIFQVLRNCPGVQRTTLPSP